jgi:hypothetical protein
MESTPTPPASAPAWDNFVVSLANAAILGIVPTNALAVGVKIDGLNVQFVFQLSQITDEDAEDMDDIVSEMEVLADPGLIISKTFEVRADRAISPHDGVRWIFLSRVEHATEASGE